MGEKVLLYSGGTDSWLIARLWKPNVLLYVDMKSKYSKAEMKKLAPVIIDGKRIPITFAKLPLGQFEDPDTAFIPCRNMYLLMLASNYGDEICLGANKEDIGGSSDKDLDFLSEAEHLLNRLLKKQSLYKGKEIKIEKSFLNYTKEELLQQYLDNGGDINEFKEQTFSCYTPETVITYPKTVQIECMNCKACFRKFIVAYGNGAKYTLVQKIKMYKFMEKNVVHKSHHAVGRYFLEKEDGEKTLKVIQKFYREMNKELNLD